MDINSVSEHDIGTTVIYIPRHDPNSWERGVITNYNKSYIFVRFDGEKLGKACSPETLSNKVKDLAYYEMEKKKC